MNPPALDPMEVMEEVYPGKSPERQEAEDAAIEAAVEREQNDETVDDRHRLAELEAKLKEQGILIQRLMALKGAGLQQLIDSATTEAHMKKRFALYALIRQSGRKPIVNVMPSDNPQQNGPVILRLNERPPFEIPRGKNTEIPVEYLELLDTARYEGEEPLVDELGHVQLRRYCRWRFPFALVSHYEEQKLAGLME